MKLSLDELKTFWAYLPFEARLVVQIVVVGAPVTCAAVAYILTMVLWTMNFIEWSWGL